MDTQSLKQILKEQIIKELNLLDIDPNEIQDDAPLFVDGLGLDSIDSLELIIILDKYHGIKIPNEEVGRKVLYSINSMVKYIETEKAKM